MSGRLDTILVAKDLVKTRSKAKQLIESGMVTVNGNKVIKPSYVVNDDDVIKLTGKFEYVGRGGEKLGKALKVFGIDPAGRIALDVGASTGGFTDCLLKNGAYFVYAVDVGRDQLSEDLLHDARIRNMENTDIRNVSVADFDHGVPDLVTVDVSFISSLKILPVISNLIDKDHDVILLIKPQFESLKSKKGVIRNKADHIRILKEYINGISNGQYIIKGLDYSPIRGGEGNIEFLAHLSNHGDRSDNIDIISCVEKAHDDFRSK